MKQLKLSDKCNHETLTNFGFKKYGMNYKMFIPLYQKNGETLIELHILLSCIDDYIGYDVIDVNNKTLYTAYYNQEYIHENLVLESVKKKINTILENMAEQNIIAEECLNIA